MSYEPAPMRHSLAHLALPWKELEPLMAHMKLLALSYTELSKSSMRRPLPIAWPQRTHQKSRVTAVMPHSSGNE